jgi:two-component system, NarL family, invasion response regulator UvrY
LSTPAELPGGERALKIMLVEPRSSMRRLITELLRHDFRVDALTECPRGEQASGEFLRLQPDVVVCQLELPGISGAETADRLIRRQPRASIVTFGRDSDGIRRDRALRQGARGYVRESHLRENLAAAIRVVAGGGHYLDPETARELALRGPHPATAPLAALSMREFEVFCLIVSGEPLDTIAQRLSLGYKTVAGYGTRIRSKLGVRKTTELEQLATAWGLNTG